MKLHVATAALLTITARADRADDLISQMTLAEKITYLGGDGMGNYPDDGRYVGTIPPLDRDDLHVPALLYNDGPQGFRDDKNGGTSTAFPSGLCDPG